MPEKVSMDRATGCSNVALLNMTTQIVAAFVGRAAVPVAEVPALISTVHASLVALEQGKAPAAGLRPEPKIPVRKSVTSDYIFCLEDGKKLKMLRRHLKTAYNMTPEQYRERWNLPADYPMTAPNYAKQRSRLAKQNGLGTSRGRRKKV